VHLKLTHRRYLDGSASNHALAVKEPPAEGTYESAAARRIADRLERAEGAVVLDLGVLSGETVTTLAGWGARVHVHDVMTPLARDLATGQSQAADLLAELKLLPESLDVVLAWELLDFLPLEEARRVMTRLGRWLKPKGLLLAVFNAVSSDQVHRFRLREQNRVQMQGALPLPEVVSARTNNEALSLFSGFTLLHSALMRTQVREVLGQRNPD
jgi:cyclopropane fatty-acyl-phospholipid synthase-like methyltransferase